MSTTTVRTANHEVVTFTGSGTVHLAADGRHGHVLACNGRTVQGLGASLGTTTGVTCRSCLKGARDGRIMVEGR